MFEMYDGRGFENAAKIGRLLNARNVTVPIDFERMCWRNCMTFPHFGHALGEIDVKNAVEMADYWKDTIGENQYEKLVHHIIYSLYRIQCAVLSNNPLNENMYIGNVCTLKEGIILGCREKDLKITTIRAGSKKIIIRD